MKTLTLIIAALMFSAGIEIQAKALPAGTAAELRHQVNHEISDVLKTTFLKYCTADLNGTVIVEMSVNENGKLYVKGIKGENHNLRECLYSKLSTLNLWTSPDLSDTVLRYKINYRN